MKRSKNKRLKYDGSGFGREYIQRLRTDADHKLMINYFVDNPVFPEKYFSHQFWMSLALFKYIVDCVKLHD
jgi:hypothetical protein